MTSDATLLQRIRNGDQAALADFIQHRRPQLLAFIQKNLSDAMRRKVDPEDLIQEVSVEGVRALPGVDIGDRDPFNWLCQIAERRIIDAHRHHFGTQKRDAAREQPLGSPGGDGEQAGLINLLVASMTSPSQAFSRDQREFRLLEAIQSLPQEQQDALRMRYVENLPSKEIADRLNKSDVAVRVMLSRSLNKLKDLLGPDAAPR
jgi:RNA polymerase sigma-70 factor (ECF subfamily)